MAKLKRQSGETYKCNVFVHYFLQTNLDETLPRINFFFKKMWHILTYFVPAFRPDSEYDRSTSFSRAEAGTIDLHLRSLHVVKLQNVDAATSAVLTAM